MQPWKIGDVVVYFGKTDPVFDRDFAIRRMTPVNPRKTPRPPGNTMRMMPEGLPG
jgi:hypothetical protein